MKCAPWIATTLLVASAAQAVAEGEVNIYSSRHYDTDERLYSDFTDQTGIVVNRLEGNGDEIIARMEAEGQNSPADILITVDTSRLERAKLAGVLQSIESPVLEARVPEAQQDAENQWFGFSQRARIIFYDKADVDTPPLDYLSLADPAYEGMVCHRSSSNVYSQTLLSAIIEIMGKTRRGPGPQAWSPTSPAIPKAAIRISCVGWFQVNATCRFPTPTTSHAHCAKT